MREVADVLSKFNKAMLIYDSANVYVPFAIDLVSAQSPVPYCVTVGADSMTETCPAAIAPKAIIGPVSPTYKVTGESVGFSGGRSYDDVTPVGSLSFRWDFDGDGQFDTSWTNASDAAWTYRRVGQYVVRLEVRDADGLVGRDTYGVYVFPSGSGGSARHIKAFGNVKPWDTLAFEATMADLGFVPGEGDDNYQRLTSDRMAIEILVPGEDLVVIMNDQDQRFYDDLAASLGRFVRFVENGGIVLWGASDLGWSNGSLESAGVSELPGGTRFSYFYDPINYNVNPGSALMSGLPSEFYGSYASHEGFYNLPGDAVVYARDTRGYATLVEYRYGEGWMMLTGQPLEYYVGYYAGTNPLSELYPRLFDYILARDAASMSVLAEKALSPSLLRIVPVPPSHVERP
jgi:hypothetical protein